MYCPFCGSEYKQNLNYCKRCGEILNPGALPSEARVPRPNVAAFLACCLTVFGLGGLLIIFSAYYQLVKWGLRGDELLVPIMGGLLFLGGVSVFLIYLLSRAITTLHQTRHVVYAERPALPESRQVPYASPTEARRPAVEMSSVTEPTTRQFGAAREPVGHE